MNDLKNIKESFLEAARGMALYSAFTVLFFTPLLLVSFLSYLASQALDAFFVFPLGILLGFIAGVFRVKNHLSLFKQYTHGNRS